MKQRILVIKEVFEERNELAFALEKLARSYR